MMIGQRRGFPGLTARQAQDCLGGQHCGAEGPKGVTVLVNKAARWHNEEALTAYAMRASYLQGKLRLISGAREETLPLYQSSVLREMVILPGTRFMFIFGLWPCTLTLLSSVLVWLLIDFCSPFQ